jgi:HK97 family phage major capsid protein
VAEGDSLTESNPTFDTIKLAPKHVGALSSVSRQLLQQANPSIEQLIRDDFVSVIGLAVDKAMLHGLAANDEPVASPPPSQSTMGSFKCIPRTLTQITD